MEYKSNKCFILICFIILCASILFIFKPVNSVQQQSVVIGSEENNPYKIIYDKCNHIDNKKLKDNCINWELKNAKR